MFDQLKNWAQWKKQRTIMFVAWALYFVAPFVVYLYPFRTAFDHSMFVAQATYVLDTFRIDVDPRTYHMVVGLAFGLQALLALGPKVISLMPGLIRASIVTKLQFPGTTAPGWLMMLAAPFYALFAYIIVLLPYQITGSWQFVAGNAGILAAQVFIGVVGAAADGAADRPRNPTTASTRRGSRTSASSSCSAVFMVYGLYDFITSSTSAPWRVVIERADAWSRNVLLDTLIGTDAIVAAMAYLPAARPSATRCTSSCCATPSEARRVLQLEGMVRA